MIYQTLDDVTIHEWLTEELKQKYKLESLEDTLHALHRPKDRQDLLRARRTYAFTELFMFELRMQWLNRLEKSSDEAIEIITIFKSERFYRNFTFELTDAQKECE